MERNCGADNTVVISMRACDRGKSEALGTRSAEGVPCEGWLVVRVRGSALTGLKDRVRRIFVQVRVAKGQRYH